jgi:hypothetical protein
MDTTQSKPGNSTPSGLQKEPATPAYAHPDKLLPEDELYEARFLTSFLYWTNTIDSRAGVTDPVEADGDDKVASDILTALSPLFVRKDELVALTIKDAKDVRACYEVYDNYAESDPKDKDDGDDDVDVEQEDEDSQDNDGETDSSRAKDRSKEALFTASNNVQETDRLDQEIPKIVYPPLAIKILPSVTRIANEKSMTKWLLSRTTDRLNSDHPKTNVEFQEHIGNVMTLIKNTHECESEDRFEAHRRLRDYILLSSCSKIHKRIKLGTERRDLFEYTTKTGTKVRADSNVMSPTFVECLDYIPKRERDAVCRAFNKTELLILKDVANALRVGAEDKFTNVDQWRPEGWKTAQIKHVREVSSDAAKIENRIAALKDDEELRFDADFIVPFQSVIAGVVINVRHSFEDLVFWKKQAQLHRQKVLVEKRPYVGRVHIIAEHVTGVVDELTDLAGEWFRMLHALIQTLRPFVKTNLRCLREFYGLENSMPDDQKAQIQSAPTPEPKGGPSSPGAAPVEDKVQAQSPSAAEPLPIRPVATTPSREGISKDDSTNPQLGKIMDSSPAPEGFEPPAPECSDDLADAINKMKVKEKEKRESDDAPEAGNSSWEDTTLGWLDLICLHMSSIATLMGKDSPSPYDVRVSKIILNANVSLVKATMPYRDEQLYVKKYLDKYVMDTGKTLTEAQVSKIVEWTKTHGRGLSDRHLNSDSDMKMFSGTYHCETIMLVLYLLERYWDEIIDPEPNLDLDDPTSMVRDKSKLHLRLPSRRVTSTFKDALDVLQVSKRCCPACNALVSHVIANYKADMIYPGNHTQWYPIALPSFTEIGAGRAVISAAKSALQGRFNKISKETQTKNMPAKRYISPASPTNNIAFSEQSVDTRVYAKRKRVVSNESVEPIVAPAELANTSKTDQTKKKSENQLKKELKKQGKHDAKRLRALDQAKENKALEEAEKAGAEAKAEADAKTEDAP